jgi:HTH-type transcriptional regulator/antitoxin HigA
MSAHAIDWLQAVHAGIRPIRSEEELALRTAEHMALAFKLDRSPEEDDALAMLTLLIEGFEDAHATIPDAGPVEVVRFLMERNSLQQRDLIPQFGSEAAVSLYLNGKRELTLKQIVRLCERFRLEPSAFLPSPGATREAR